MLFIFRTTRLVMFSNNYLYFLVIEFISFQGFEDEGIFRVTGTFKDISSIKEQYANGKETTKSIIRQRY